MNTSTWYTRLSAATIIVFYVLATACTPIEETSMPPDEEPSQSREPESAVIQPNTALEQETMEVAEHYTNIFAEAYGVQINPSQAVGLDARFVEGESGVLASTIAPVDNDAQFYEDWQVFGYISISNDNISKYTGLGNDEAYLIGCIPESENCIVISSNGETMSISPEVTFQPSYVDIPFAAYEEGSIRACFNVGSVRICITIF